MRRLAFALSLAALLPACKRSTSVDRADGAVDPAKPEPAVNPKIAEILDGLASLDEARSRAAEKSLREIEKTLREKDGVALIRGTTRSFPKSKLPLLSPQASILYAVGRSPHPSYLEPLRGVFAQLDPPAKTAALQLLSRLDTPEAARAFVELVAQSVAQSTDLEIHAGGFEDSLSFGAILFPALLDSARGGAADGIARLALAYLQGGAVQGASLAPRLGPLVAEYGRLYDRLAPSQRPADAGPTSSQPAEYEEARDTAEVMLDLFGWIPTPDTMTALQQAVGLRDPRLVCFAASSLVRRGATVAPAALELVASDADSRGLLFHELAALKQSALFPSRWATQPALAESVMVRWLEYPTELGDVPTAIELMNVVSEDVGEPDGVMDWYLFRFRSDDKSWKDESWMAGVAGPFRRREEPTTRDYGDTFSSFDPWASKTPQEHVAKIREIIAKWAAHRAGGGNGTP